MRDNNLYTAHREWANRPQDERYQSFEDLYRAVKARSDRSLEKEVPIGSLQVVTTAEGDLRLARGDDEAELTNWSFGQLSRFAKAPADYVRRLPAHLAAQCLNHGIQEAHAASSSEQAKTVQVFLQLAEEGQLARVRAVNGENYGRILDFQSLDFIRSCTEGGAWKLPLAYAGGKWGADKVPSGAYASDRDVFLFMVDESRPIEIGQEVLHRGFFLWNSEVGSKSFGLETFLYRFVCGNHIVWNATDVKTFRIYHRGDEAGQRASRAAKQLTEYTNRNTEEERAIVSKAITYQVGATDDKVVEWISEKGFTQTVAKRAVEVAKTEEGGAGTLWQVVQGLTGYARTLAHTDVRVDIERKAGNLLSLAN
jgi:hypothetical protein